MIQPPAAAIRVDGRPVTMGIEGIVKLAAGTHTIDAAAPDFTSDHRDITVVAGVPQTVSLKLTAIPRTGRARIAATQLGARVAVDGREIGAAPVDVELGAGGHRVEVTAPGFAPNVSELVVAAGQARDVMIVLDLPPPPPVTVSPFYHRWWFWTGVGVVTAAVGTYALWPRTQGPIAGTTGATTNVDQ
jgi:PEGA domain